MGNEDEPKSKEANEVACSSSAGSSIQRIGGSTEILEENMEGQHRMREDLIIELPTRTLEDGRDDFITIKMPQTPSPTAKRVNFSPVCSPTFAQAYESPDNLTPKNKSIRRIPIPKLSFKYRTATSEIEKAAMLALGASSEARGGKPRISGAISLTKLFTSRTKKTSSLPVTPIAHSNPESMHGGNAVDSLGSAKGEGHVPIHRSHSVPVISKEGSVKQFDNLGGVFRVIAATSQLAEGADVKTPKTSPRKDEHDDSGEDIPEEKAVCRICLIELGEGADTLKMECSCKGELALAHQECAVKWFSIKGNKTCDVCKQEVKNLPVTLFRVQNGHAVRRGRAQNDEVVQYRIWQDVPVLVIVSMLAYFCFLEQLLVGKLGSGAIAISLPFSCILGVLATMTSTTMVRRKYVWGYATIQFALVVLSAHLFYSLLHMQAVLSVLLATFTGFGVAMCGTSVLGELSRWRRRGPYPSNQQPTSQNVTEQSSAPTPQNVTTPETGASEIMRGR